MLGTNISGAGNADALLCCSPGQESAMNTAAATIEVESTLTARYQTTVPASVRQALKLNKSDKLRYAVREDGTVTLERVGAEEAADPVIESFLGFIAADIQQHPERVRAIDTNLLNRIDKLVGHIDIDLDAPLPDGDE